MLALGSAGVFSEGSVESAAVRRESVEMTRSCVVSILERRMSPVVWGNRWTVGKAEAICSGRRLVRDVEGEVRSRGNHIQGELRKLWMWRSCQGKGQKSNFLM